MIRGLLNIALYTISVCSVASSSSSSIISRRHALQSLTSVVVQHHHRSGRLRLTPGDDDTINSLVFHLRGGEQQQNDTHDDSYHGNYIFPPDTETAPPPSSTQAATSTVSATGATTTGVDTTTTTTTTVPAAPPPTLAIATSTNSKLSNLQERTGPALLMLGAIYLLLKYTGKTGLIGLVFVMQCAMYAESTLVVESYYHNHPTATTTSNMEGGGGGGEEEEKEFIPFQLHKWWWFATAIMMTSGRKLLSEYTTTGTVVITMDQWNLITFGMVAVSLVGTVVQLAMVSSIATTKAEEVYRQFIRKMACCHVSLLLLVGMSSFWIRTVEEYGLVWVLFPALLVVVNDTMAYVFGVLLGKHKLLPRLSPKKTVEGFVGAGMSTLAVAAPLLQRMMMGIATTTSTTDGGAGQTLRQHALMMALYISLISPFGGFLASAVKRAHGAKDFGSLIPGHGGVVDRFDCQVVTAPFVYLYLKTCST